MKPPHLSLKTTPSVRDWRLLAALMVGLWAGNFTQAAQTFFVAPKRVGAGNGDSAKNAAAFRGQAFWDKVNRAVQQSPVEVQFLAGRYVISSDPAKALP